MGNGGHHPRCSDPAVSAGNCAATPDLAVRSCGAGIYRCWWVGLRAVFYRICIWPGRNRHPALLPHAGLERPDWAICFGLAHFASASIGHFGRTGRTCCHAQRRREPSPSTGSRRMDGVERRCPMVCRDDRNAGEIEPGADLRSVRIRTRCIGYRLDARTHTGTLAARCSWRKSCAVAWFGLCDRRYLVGTVDRQFDVGDSPARARPCRHPVDDRSRSGRRVSRHACR